MSLPSFAHRFRSAPPATRSRRGVALVESALTFPIVVLVLMALLDLGMAATRYNALAEVSRHIAREAIRHGSLAPDSEGTWGANRIQGSMDMDSEMVASARSKLLFMRADDVTIDVTWPDGGNAPGDRVRVEVTTWHLPLIPGLFAWGPLELRSATTMCIVN